MPLREMRDAVLLAARLINCKRGWDWAQGQELEVTLLTFLMPTAASGPCKFRSRRGTKCYLVITTMLVQSGSLWTISWMRPYHTFR
jgi:hypothetical protein